MYSDYTIGIIQNQHDQCRSQMDQTNRFVDGFAYFFLKKNKRKNRNKKSQINYPLFLSSWQPAPRNLLGGDVGGGGSLKQSERRKGVIL
jgi:hypothetical protein